MSAFVHGQIKTGFGLNHNLSRHLQFLPKLAILIFAAMNVKDDLQHRWWNLEAKLVERFDKKPDLETILFLIGIQEFGQLKEKFTKEQKQDLMHIAVCSLLSESGYYELEGVDQDGWPHFKQLKPMPEMDAIAQEYFLKDHVLLYFETHGFLTTDSID
jgi:hypothetical protein